MLDCFKCINMKKTGIFAAGVLFGTAGVKLLASKDAKKVYRKTVPQQYSEQKNV